MRTFIFGAGASVHAGYPLAVELWRAMEGWTRATFPEHHEFRYRVDTMNAEFDLSKSFELVLTDLDDRIEALLQEAPTPPEKFEFVHLRVALKAMIPLYFNSLRSQPAELYRVFANQVLAPGDAVITFNYDLALDREMKRASKWSIGNGYGFEIDSVSLGDSPCRLFKLHGSTNWRGELFQGSEGFSIGNSSLGQRPIIDPAEFQFLEYGNAADPQCHNGRVRIESIIMPTAKKKFFNETSLGREWEGFWDSLWLQAGEALNSSNEVYLIGYSAPEYDTRAKNLLAKTIDENAAVRVCCHNGTDGVIQSLKKLERLEDIDIQPACATTFEGWVSSMSHPEVSYSSV